MIQMDWICSTHEGLGNSIKLAACPPGGAHQLHYAGIEAGIERPRLQ